MASVCSADMKEESTLLPGGKKLKQIPEVRLKGWTKKLFFNPGHPRPPKERNSKVAGRVRATEAINKAKLSRSPTPTSSIPVVPKPTNVLPDQENRPPSHNKVLNQGNSSRKRKALRSAADPPVGVDSPQPRRKLNPPEASKRSDKKWRGKKIVDDPKQQKITVMLVTRVLN
jgi:hypothetical protein